MVGFGWYGSKGDVRILRVGVAAVATKSEGRYNDDEGGGIGYMGTLSLFYLQESGFGYSRKIRARTPVCPLAAARCS